MSTVAIIQARLNSSRFPGKVLVELAGKPLLQHALDRLRQAKRVDRIVVATCYPGGGAIAGHCEDWDVECYIDSGPENDVLGRFNVVANKWEADLIVRVCGDNPLIWPEGIDRLVAAINDEPRWKRHYDYAAYQYSKDRPAILKPNGYFGELMTAEALSRAARECAPGDPDREHVTKYIYQNPHRFSCRWLRVPKWYRDAGSPHHAVDTPEDLDEIRDLMEATT